MILMSVDLPAPLSPIRPSTSPASIFRSTLVNAWMAPKFFEISAQLEQTHGSPPSTRAGRHDSLFQNQIAVQPRSPVATTAKQRFTRS